MSTQKLTYKDCLELKNAGFPQKSFIAHNNGQRQTHHYESYYIPTLDELIEECGDVTLIKKRDAPCEGEEVDTFTYEAFQDEDGITFIDDTPEQAVKNLYIAINKK